MSPSKRLSHLVFRRKISNTWKIVALTSRGPLSPQNASSHLLEHIPHLGLSSEALIRQSAISMMLPYASRQPGIGKRGAIQDEHSLPTQSPFEGSPQGKLRAITCLFDIYWFKGESITLSLSTYPSETNINAHRQSKLIMSKKIFTKIFVICPSIESGNHIIIQKRI